MKPLIHIADEYALISASYVASVRFPFRRQHAQSAFRIRYR